MISLLTAARYCPLFVAVWVRYFFGTRIVVRSWTFVPSAPGVYLIAVSDAAASACTDAAIFSISSLERDSVPTSSIPDPPETPVVLCFLKAFLFCFAVNASTISASSEPSSSYAFAMALSCGRVFFWSKILTASMTLASVFNFGA